MSPPRPPIPVEANVSPDLRAAPQWSLWEYRWTGDKWTKVPINPATRNGADSTDCATWGTWATVQRILSKGADYGAAFMFSALDPFFGFDFDDCVNPETGEVDPWVAAYVRRFIEAGAYVEFSPSGKGIKGIGRGKKPGPYCRTTKFPHDVELYEQKRPFTVTGRLYPGCEPGAPIGDCQDVLNDLYAEAFAERIAREQERAAQPATTSTTCFDLDDQTLLDIGRNGPQMGPRFSALYDRGDLSAYRDDHSAADLALLNYLAFLTGRDAVRMERLFSASALGQRAKWREREDYRDVSIELAIADCRKVYEPPAKPWRPNTARVRHVQVKQATEASKATPSLAELADLDENDSGNAKRLVARHGDELRYTPERGWFAWEQDHFSFDQMEPMRRAKDTQQGIFAEVPLLGGGGDEDEDKAAKRRYAWALASGNATRLQSMLLLAQSEPGIAIPITQWDADEFLLGTLGATIDLRTGTARAPRREDLITKRAPVVFDPAATCPVFLDFLRTAMDGNENLVSYLQRVFGLCLTGVPADRCMWFFYGSGRNGKSTLLNILHDLLGAYAKKAPAETLLQKHGSDGIPNDLADLAGARVVTSAEMAEGRRLNEPRIKDLTGRDTITARFLRKEFFTFSPTFKLFMYGNHRPIVRGTDNGIWDRLKLVPFTVRVERPDEDLPNKLRAELPGILNWALAGCLAWQRDGLQHPAEVEAATAEYRQEQDPLADFLADCCAVDSTFRASGPDLWGAYLRWCDSNHERGALSRKAFSQQLLERGFVQQAKKDARYWLGLGLVSRSQEADGASAVTGDRW